MLIRAYEYRKRQITYMAMLSIMITIFMLLSVLKVGFCAVKHNAQNMDKNPDNALSVAPIPPEVFAEPTPVETLPVAESKNNGYWWIKQDQKDRLSYIEYLVYSFGLKGKGIKSGEIADRLDIFYNPVDDPLDIKMDISLERAFYRIVKDVEKGASR
jgi:hypothetical protein